MISDPQNDIPQIERERQHNKAHRKPNYFFRRAGAVLLALGVGAGAELACESLEERSQPQNPGIVLDGNTTVRIGGDVDSISDAVVVEVTRSGYDVSEVPYGSLVDMAKELNGGSTHVIDGQRVIVPDVRDIPTMSTGAQEAQNILSGFGSVNETQANLTGSLPLDRQYKP
jgi:hypothetical protein